MDKLLNAPNTMIVNHKKDVIDFIDLQWVP